MSRSGAGGQPLESSSQPVVSSADLARRFGQLRQMHGDQAIFVTHHGRPTHVLTTVNHYTQLARAAEGGQSSASPTLTVQDLADCLDHAVLVVTNDLQLVVANRLAHLLLERPDRSLVGRSLYDAIPEFDTSLLQTYLRRAIGGKEPCCAEIPSLFRAERWVRINIIPFAGHVAILFHDITDEMTRHRLADTRQSIKQAMTAHGGIGYVRVNVRGHIDHTEPTFCDMVQLPAARLLHVAMPDLIPPAHRVAFRDALDAVLRGEGTQRVDASLLANDGQAVPVQITLAELRGSYGVEGAVLLLTRR